MRSKSKTSLKSVSVKMPSSARVPSRTPELAKGHLLTFARFMPIGDVMALHHSYGIFAEVRSSYVRVRHCWHGVSVRSLSQDPQPRGHGMPSLSGGDEGYTGVPDPVFIHVLGRLVAAAKVRLFLYDTWSATIGQQPESMPRLCNSW